MRRTTARIGDYIHIRKMHEEPQYNDLIGKVEIIDDTNQIHGTWGGCALIPEIDSFDIISEERYKLYTVCEETNTRKSAMDFLVKYYMDSFKWEEKQACEHCINLFKSGTINEIKLLGRDGKQI